MSQVDAHPTFLVIFLPQSWYGRDWKMPTTGHSSQRPKSICPFRVFQHQIYLFLIAFSNSLMSTNGQLNDTLCYHIKPTNSMCNVISCFHLKEPCSLFFVSSQLFFSFSKSVINKKYLDKYKNKKNLFKNLVLRWKFASV